MTISQIKELRESEDHIEFKEAKHNYPFAGGKHTDPRDRRHCVLGYVVALANEKGGCLAMGLMDKKPHQVVGSDFAENATGELEDEIYERLEIRVRTEELYDEGKRILLIHVPSRPIGQLLKFEGVPLMRTGESLREMSDAEILRVLTEQEPDFSAKVCDGLIFEDLDAAAVREMKTRYAEKQNNPTFVTLPDQQAVSDLGLVVDGKLTYAALILLGKGNAIAHFLPQYNIIIEYRRNRSMIQSDDRKEFQMPLFLAIKEVWRYIDQPLLNPKQHVQDGAYILDIPSFNEEVVREAILNACCHRSMQIQSSVVLKLYPDALTITNAGGFPIGVETSNILTVNSVPRCKLLSDVLLKTGLVEKSGQGVDKMFFYCLSEGKALPDYSGTDNYQVCLTLRAPIIDKAFVNFVRHEQELRDDAHKLNVFDLLALWKVRSRDYADIASSTLDKLEQEELVTKTKGEYFLNNKYKNTETDKSRNIPLEQLQVVQSCFEQETFISRSMLVEAFGVSLTEKQVRSLIAKLEEYDFIKRIGAGRNTQYSKTELFPKVGPKN